MPSSLLVIINTPARATHSLLAREALREAARSGGIRALSSAHVDALDDLVVAWRGQGPIDLPGGTASRVGRGAHARIAFVAREVGAPTAPDPA